MGTYTAGLSGLKGTEQANVGDLPGVCLSPAQPATHKDPLDRLRILHLAGRDISGLLGFLIIIGDFDSSWKIEV